MLTAEVTIAIVIPVFNDWRSLTLMVGSLDNILASLPYAVDLIIVDDGSTAPTTFTGANFASIRRLSIVELKRNVGHQRAITLGLAYAGSEREFDAAIVMDADGEDAPEDVPGLLQKCLDENLTQIVFAKRTKRSEGPVFRFFYALYRGFYRALTGRSIRMGNFSVVPKTLLMKLMVVSEVWNHYAAGVLKSNLPYSEVQTSRGRRLSGEGKMSFVALVTHGLSSISVFGDVAGVRLLLSSLFLIATSFIGIFVVVLVRLFTDLAIPGWATYVIALLLIILMQAVTLSLFFIFLVLNSRDTASFLPVRDYTHFIAKVTEVPVKN